MNNPKICLLFHINFNHLSLTFEQRVTYIEHHLDKILDAIIVPTTISICAEDLLLLNLWNSKCYQKLITHSQLKFLLMPFNHVLPQLFPQHFIDSTRIGKKLLTKLIPQDKLLGIGYSPEVDLPQPKLLPKISKYWKGLILGETRIKIKKLHQKQYPPLFWITDNNRKLKIKGYLSRRHILYRDFLHSYLRERKNKKDVYQAIIDDYGKYSCPAPLLLRIDMETLVFNAPLKGSIVLPPPIGRFLSLQKYLTKHKLEFIHIKTKFSRSEPHFTPTQITPSNEESHKWKNPRLHNILCGLKIPKSDWEKYFYQLSLTCSDYYCTNFHNITLDHASSGYSIHINKTRYYRDQESAIKLHILTNNDFPEQLKFNASNPDLVKYIKYQQVLPSLTQKYIRQGGPIEIT